MNGLVNRARRVRGFTLVELMVALAIGLIVTGAAITVFLSTSRTYDATESLGRVQENMRVAFELMARDIREAGGNPCERGLPIYNVLNNPQSLWYTDAATGIRGFGGTQAFADMPFGTGAGRRIAGTDAIEIKSAGPGTSIVKHVPTSAQFKLASADHGLHPGDIALACDFAEVAVFQVTNAQSGTNETVVHNTGAGTPGNCSKGLGYSAPPNCGTNGNQYAFGCYMGKYSGSGCDGDEDGIKDEPEDVWPAVVARLRMQRWYIGANDQGGKSLYQSSVRNDGGELEVENNEIVDGVEDMTLEYLLVGATKYVDAAEMSAADWASDKVVAVGVDITLTGAGTPGTEGKDIQRHLKMTTTIRNHTE